MLSYGSRTGHLLCKKSGLLYLLFFIFFLLSTICKGVSIRKWSLHSQKENKGSKKNAGTTLSATSIIRRKSPRKSFTGNFHRYSSQSENITCTVFIEWISNFLSCFIWQVLLFQILVEQINTTVITVHASRKCWVDYFASTICMGSFSHWAFFSIMDNCSVNCPGHFCHCIMISIHRTKLCQQSSI